MSTPVSRLMQRAVRSVGVDETVEQIEALLAAHNLSWLPVLGKDGEMLGAICESDLQRLRAAMPGLASMHARQLCIYKPVSVQPDAHSLAGRSST
jgi:predicted transcriptional regulator